jgi:hypothetical protein
MRIFITILLLSVSTAFAQSYFPLLAPEMMASDSLTHSSLRLYDFKTPENLSFCGESNSLYIAPIMETTLYSELSENAMPYNISAGFGLQYSGVNNLRISASLLGATLDFPSYIAAQYDTATYFLGTSNLLKSADHSKLLSPNIDISYQLSKVFSLHAGNSKVFLGEGYRSLFLSDQGVNTPHLSLKMDLGKVQYLYRLEAMQQDYTAVGQKKYSAIHYLSWNFLTRWNLSFFESVTWQNADSIRPRGMEWTYLNPILFFRPAEFAIGSPDNMLLGGGISYRIGKKTTIYTQVLLDEFFIEEMKNWAKHTIHPNDTSIPYGAWVNKQAFQLGVKSFDIAGIKGLSAVSEFNFVRPYTYSHVNPLNSYSNNNQPLAHPFGANFYEILLRLDYQNENWHFISHSFFKRTGYDTPVSHYGQNILLSTFDSPRGNNIPVAYYGNVVGQGIPVKVFHTSLEARYKLQISNQNIWLRLGTVLRNENVQNVSKSYLSIFGGILINMHGEEYLQR